jgi:histidyl-tRNA synthetase
MAIEPRLLKGFRDHLPADMAKRQQMLRTIENVLKTFAFQPLETPTLEYADILLGKLGDEGEKLLYRFKDHGDRDVAMRYDMTVPLARVVAQYPDLAKPFKRYQVGPVWRADNTQRGRYREFYQFDMDIVGSDSHLADAEVLVLMQNILLALGVAEFTIRVNDRQYLSGLAKSVGLPEDQLADFYTGLDKWDKIGQEKVADYWHEHGISAQHIHELLSELEKVSEHPSSSTIKLAQEMGLQPQYVKIDPTIVRGLDYYTGIVFETTLTKAPEFGSVFSGGRYDDLVATFSKQSIPAVGTSIGVDRLLAALEELGLANQVNPAAKVFVTVFDDSLVKNSLACAAALRQNGIPTDLSFVSGNLGKQLKYAAAQKIPFVVVIGPDEVAQNVVTLRDLRDGHEAKITLEQLVETLR